MAARAQTTSDKSGLDAEPIAGNSPEDSPNRRSFAGMLPLVGLGFWQAWWMTLASTPVVMGPIQPAPGSILLLLIVTLAGYVAATLAARAWHHTAAGLASYGSPQQRGPQVP